MTEMKNTMKPTQEQRIVLSDIASFFGDHEQDYKIILRCRRYRKSTILKWVLDMLLGMKTILFICTNGSGLKGYSQENPA